MGERTLNFGTDATDADYQVRDSSSTGGDLIIEHLPSGATFEYDATESAWVPTDPIGTANRKASAITTTSVNTDNATINESVKAGSKPYKLFVRTSGNDSNTGLSESDAVATISGAVESILELPINNGKDETVVIDVEGGQTFTESSSLPIYLPWIGELLFQSSDGSQYTIQFDSSLGFAIRHCYVTFEDALITDEGSTTVNQMIKCDSATCVMEDGTTVKGANSTEVYGQYQSLVSLNSGSTVTGPGKGVNNSNGVVAHSSSYVNASSGATIQDCSQGVNVLESSSAGIKCTLSNHTYAIRSVDTGDVKVDGANIESSDYAFDVKRGGGINLYSSTSFSNVSTRWNIRDGHAEDANGNHFGTFVISPEQGTRIEFGEASVSISAASDDGWDTSANTSKSQTFSADFKNSPKVFLQSNNALAIPHQNNVDPDAFDIQLRNYSTASFTTDVYWLAIGK